jgi:hypothetical protein
MADVHNIRAQMREARRQQPAPAEGGGHGVTFWIVAACAVVVGFSVVLFTPRLYPVQRTAALPTFQETRDRIEAEAKGGWAPMAPSPSDPTRYLGKSADEMGKIADSVCYVRAQAVQPHLSKTPRLTTKDVSDFTAPDDIKHYDALMHCLVTEAPARYCSGAQRTMIKAEIAMYFRGIEYAAAARKTYVAEHQRYRTKIGMESDPEIMQLALRTVRPDEKVLAGIEALMRAGYLTASQRSDINAIAPKPIRERFAQVVGNKSPCPAPPWWAVWR